MMLLKCRKHCRSLTLLVTTLLLVKASQAVSDPGAVIFPDVEIVEFTTDFEGSRSAFEGVVKASELLEMKGDQVAFKSGTKGIFVYGGDLTDRAPNNQWVLKQINNLAAQNPGRFVQILGNRDVFKFDLDQLAQRLNQPWGEKTQERYTKWLAKSGLQSVSESVNRARFMLGSILETWRAEMGPNTTYEQALASLQSEIKPGGLLHASLKNAQLVVRIGDLLFTHGAVTEANYLLLPNGTRSPKLNTWITELEKERRTTFAKWESSGSKSLGRDHVFSLSWGNNQNQLAPFQDRYNVAGNPFLPADSVISALRSEGISRTAVGHTPQGQRIAPVRTQDALFLSFNADTSDQHISSLLRFKGKETSIIHSYPNSVSVHNIQIGDVQNPIGLYTKDGYLIKGYDPNTREALLSRTNEKFVEEMKKEVLKDQSELSAATLSACPKLLQRM